jgi:hypothetical protein
MIAQVSVTLRVLEVSLDRVVLLKDFFGRSFR